MCHSFLHSGSMLSRSLHLFCDLFGKTVGNEYLNMMVYLLHWCLVAKSCPTLHDTMDCSPPVSSVHGMTQARILEYVVISFSKVSSRPRDWIHICYTGRGFLTTEPGGKPQRRVHLPRISLALKAWIVASPSGSRTQVFCMTGRDTHQYTNEDVFLYSIYSTDN